MVRFVPSRHSKLLFGRKVPMDGELTCEHLHGLVPTAYKCGTVWGIRIEVAGASLYHQGSADLDDEQLGDEPVDVFLAGVRAGASRPATGSGYCRVSIRGSSSRPTTTTSSFLWEGMRNSCVGSG